MDKGNSRRRADRGMRRPRDRCGCDRKFDPRTRCPSGTPHHWAPGGGTRVGRPARWTMPGRRAPCRCRRGRPQPTQDRKPGGWPSHRESARRELPRGSWPRSRLRSRSRSIARSGVHRRTTMRRTAPQSGGNTFRCRLPAQGRRPRCRLRRSDRPYPPRPRWPRIHGSRPPRQALPGPPREPGRKAHPGPRPPHHRRGWSARPQSPGRETNHPGPRRTRPPMPTSPPPLIRSPVRFAFVRS